MVKFLLEDYRPRKLKTVPRSHHVFLSQSSKDGVADSTLADPLSGVSSLTKQQLVDSNIVQVNKLKEKKTSVDEDKDRVNVSMFLRSPQALLESSHPSSGATRAEFVRPLPPMSSNPFENDGSFMAKKMKSILQPDSELQKESFPDEQSEAVPKPKLAPDNTGFKGNPEQIVASSSFCSRGASNCPTYTSEKRYEEDTDDLSENTAMEEEPEEKTKGSKGGTRKRKTEVHNLSERKRRDKINKKMRALKELIPNCDKVDKASMLDEAIEYLKNLQFQVQMMSIVNGVYMPPMMFPSPSAMQHINAQHLGGYSHMMGMRMQMGLGCGVPPQFPSPLMPGTAALPGNPEARVNMFGFPDEVLLRSMSYSPFASSAGRFTPQSIQLHGAGVSQSAAATAVAGQVDLPGGVNSLSTSKDINPTQLTQ